MSDNIFRDRLQELDEVEGMIDEVIDQMADVAVFVRSQSAQISTTSEELIRRMQLADEKRLITVRALDLLDLSRKRILRIGTATAKMARVVGPRHPSIKPITLRIEQQMDRMKRTALNLEQLLNTDVTGLWQYLRTQIEAIQRQTTHPALSLQHANPSN